MSSKVVRYELASFCLRRLETSPITRLCSTFDGRLVIAAKFSADQCWCARNAEAKRLLYHSKHIFPINCALVDKDSKYTQYQNLMEVKRL